MAKGYIVQDLKNWNFNKTFERSDSLRDLTVPILQKYGGKVLVRTPFTDVREGKKTGIVGIFEFPSIDKARKFYESDAYQAVKAVRDKACDADLYLVEGVTGFDRKGNKSK